MRLLPGVYTATKKDGKEYYRSSITFRGKHISLGSYETVKAAHEAYVLAGKILEDPSHTIMAYPSGECILPFEKWVILINYRDNHIYFKTPIYIQHRFFLYYLDEKTVLKFAVDDLFYYAKHKIMRRGGHLFVAEYGMQVNILTRYGIKNFAVPGRDYLFMNGDPTDFRYENIEIVNKYHGVRQIIKKGRPVYIAKIHINGDFIVGQYSTEEEAAIAYNKAAKFLWEIGLEKNFPLNFINEYSKEDYLNVYNQVQISKNIKNYQINQDFLTSDERN